MDKTAIKNFAVRARNKLIEDITQKAFELGISKDEIKDIIAFEGGFTIKGLENSKTYKKYQEKQRRKLIDNINHKGFDQVIEEVAYTWFNRFIALRFMEVNDFLPTGVRILSSEEDGKVEPDIIKEALNVDFDLNEDEYNKHIQIVYRLIDSGDTEDLYRYLLVKQCNELGKIMPQVFEEISDYTELLLPDNLLVEGSVIRDLVESIKEEDYKDQVEIVGWMYQYYISEKKDEVFADLKKNKKITKENIPAATQLFTPKWIVKYMIENSLGRLWLESHPDEELQSKWKYYLEEAEQEPEVRKQLDELIDPNLKPEDIKLLDPSMGSGHILVYAFDVLYDIYLKANYSERDIPRLILEKNLYGLDIDDRAGQLAAFALIMKAVSKNKRLIRKKVKIKLNVCSIQESNGLTKEAIEFFVNTKDGNIDKGSLRDNVEYLIKVFHDAKEYGSILDVDKVDFDAIERRIEEIRAGDIKDLFELQYKEVILEKLPSLIQQGRIMSKKYEVVCTNPPYMSNRGINNNLKKLINDRFEDVKSDLFAVFIEKGFKYTKKNGHLGFMTPFVWMFISSYEKLREKIIAEKSITSLIQLEYSGFAEATVPVCTFTLRNYATGETGEYIKLSDFKGVENQPIKTLEAVQNRNVYYRYTRNTKDFNKIPGTPIAYWVSNKFGDIFKNNKKLGDIYVAKQGMTTGNNDKFLRLWHEVNIGKVGFGYANTEEACISQKRWFPYNKGGNYKKWYGNNEYVVNYENDGREMKHYTSKLPQGTWVRLKSREYYFKESITWTFISSANFGVRYSPQGFIFDVAGSSIFPGEHIKYILGFLSTKLVFDMLKVINPTLNYQIKDIKSLPIILDKEKFPLIESLVNNNINIAKSDWDSFETSWDFRRHPVLDLDKQISRIKDSFEGWKKTTEKLFIKLKNSEEELNRIFIDIYDLKDELTPEVDDKDVTVTRIYDSKEEIPESMKGNTYVLTREDVIKSFISYAVGCMFGRYSLDEEGLIYAGGEFDFNRYKTFIPTRDNILIIADDEYFEDDIVSRFVDFVKITFGEETLEENLDYISGALGQKAGETARQAIRRYFLKDFYKDHIKTYKKRPIYWLFDSGRRNGFKAYMYIHRYDPYTVSRVRTDYLHKLQRMYEAEVDRIDMYLENDDITPREKSARIKKKEDLLKQIQECLVYDQVIAHVANQKLDIDLDDGVKVNYAKFQGIEVPQGEGKKPLKANLLSIIF